MTDINSGLPDLSGLNDFEREIYEYVLEKWPSTALELAEHFNEPVVTREEKKRMSSKYNYYLKKLVEKNILICKKAGNTLVVWPIVAEKYRMIHEILKGEKYENTADFVSYLKSKEVKNHA